jgi:hypothetical protein
MAASLGWPKIGPPEIRASHLTNFNPIGGSPYEQKWTQFEDFERLTSLHKNGTERGLLARCLHRFVKGKFRTPNTKPE